MELTDVLLFVAVHLIGSLVIWMSLKAATSSKPFRQDDKLTDAFFPTVASTLFLGFNLVMLAILGSDAEGVDLWLKAFYGTMFSAVAYGVTFVGCYKRASKAPDLQVLYAAVYSGIFFCLASGTFLLICTTSPV